MEPKPKTYKREVAFGLFLALGFLVFTDNVPMVEILVWPVFTFASLAYGLDWWGKGGSMHRPFSPSDRMHSGEYPERSFRRRSQRSGEYPSGEREHTDHRELYETDLRGK